MSYTIYLTDSTGTHELPPLEVPLTRVDNEIMTTVEPLSGNIYRDYMATKRIWSHSWAFLSKDEYDLLHDIYERQKAEWMYPRLTIDGENVSNLVVDYMLGPKNLIDDCGTVSDVTITLRETRQLGS